MDINDLIGKLVLFKFHKEIEDDFKIFDIGGRNIWGVLSGVEPNIGVWVKHPNYELRIWWDKKGRTIPEKDRMKKEFEADVLIPWRYIKGIMCIRDKKFDREVKEKKVSGFHQQKK